MIVYLGFGSNLSSSQNSRTHSLKRAYELLSGSPSLNFLKTSSLFETPALLPQDSEPNWNIPFLNCVSQIEFNGSLEELLQLTQKTESELGRTPHKKWAPRIIDIDILHCEEKSFHSSQLSVPHPEVLKRNFVLSPYCEIAPHSQGPGPSQDPNQPQTLLNISRQQHPLPLWMNIVNLTPDSFSDGNTWTTTQHFEELCQQADSHHISYLDVGAESTRPGAITVSADEEWQRLSGFLEVYRQKFTPSHSTYPFHPKLSVDTRYGSTAARAIEYGCTMINDVSGLTDPYMLEVLQSCDVQYVLMHNLGVPVDKQKTLPLNCDPVLELKNWFENKLEFLEKNNIPRHRVIIDPGIGFGKTAAQNLNLLRRTEELHSLQQPLLIGHSRKSFMNTFSKQPFSDRNPESLAFSLKLIEKGVEYLRVHNAHQHKAAHLAAQHFTQES